MLIYHPLYDAYHCVFRLLLISEHLGTLPIELARILDFYTLFPARVAKIKLPSHLLYGRAIAVRQANPYHEVSNQESVFRELSIIQDAAFHCIVGAGLFDKQRFEEGLITRTKNPVPDDLKRRLFEFKAVHAEIFDFILEKLSSVNVFGAGGLKDRTGLMEFRYDATA